MRKRYRYGIFIASAILACAPLAMNNNVMGTSHVVKAAAGSQSNSNSSNPAGSQSNSNSSNPAGSQLNSNSDNPANSQFNLNSGNYSDYDGRDYDHAFQSSISYDKGMHTDIKLTKDLNVDDVVNYFGDNIHVFINGQEDKDYYSYLNCSDDELERVNQISKKAGFDVRYEAWPEAISESYDKNGNYVDRLSEKDKEYTSMALEEGDKIVATDDFDNTKNLLPNKWYSWQLQDNFFAKGNPIDEATKALGDLPVEIAKRVHYDAKNNTIALMTDQNGRFPSIKSKPNADGYSVYYDLGVEQIAPTVTFTVSSDPNDKNAFEIPHDPSAISKPRNFINNAPVVPDDNNDNKTNKSTNPTDPVSDDPDANSSDWGTAPVDNGNDFEFPTVDKEDVQKTIQKTEQNIKNTDPSVNDETKEGAKKIADVDGLVFVHNAFIYNGKGNVVKSKHDVYEIKRIDQKAKILDNGKVHVIKGTEYYRIGKNRYVKVANVGKVANKVQSISTRGTIKASKKYGVRLYDKNGKATKKVLRNAKKVRFDQKKYMHGFTFYRIKGTDTWIRSGNIKFVKGSKK